MESFKWGKVFVTGLQDVDSQHRNLVSMVNDFGQVVAENTSTGHYIFSVLRDLSAYALEHFKTEENLMGNLRVDLRHIKAHVRQHADFVSDLSSLADSVDVDKPEESRMVLEFLIHWLAYHILGTDQNMARQIRLIQAGGHPDQAYESGEMEPSSSTEPLVVALSGLFNLVSKRNKTLSELNRTLELRVAKRTEELVQINKTLEKISITDHLTELPNRRFAMEQMQLFFDESVQVARPFSCMMVDADGFKTINDTYGHEAGDVVLQRLAQELRYSVRSDDIVCRLGGDEFIVICPNTDIDGVLLLGEYIRKQVASLRVPAGHGHWLGSVSIGVACTAQEKVTDVKTLLEAADKAVYEAKRSGRNCVMRGD